MTHHPKTLENVSMSFWREDQRWRALPYVKGRWAGPHGITGYIADREYCVIALMRNGQLVRGAGESLMGFPMLGHGTYLWDAAVGLSDAGIIGLIQRAASSPATSWILAWEASE